MSLTASSPFYRPLDIKAPYFNFLNIFLPSKCFPDSSVGKESACNAGDHSSTPGSGRSSGEGIDLPNSTILGFPLWPADEESACIVGDLDSIPGLRRSPGEGKGYPLQYCGLENSMDCIELQSSMDCI